MQLKPIEPTPFHSPKIASVTPISRNDDSLPPSKLKVPGSRESHASPLRPVPGTLASPTLPSVKPLAGQAKLPENSIVPSSVKLVAGQEQGVSNKVLLKPCPCSLRSQGGEITSPKDPLIADVQDVMRDHCVSVYLTATEHAKLTATAKSSRRRKGALLRDAYFSGTVITVPEPNQTKWSDLARALANANQLTAKVNAGFIPENMRVCLSELTAQIHRLRGELIGQYKTKKRGVE